MKDATGELSMTAVAVVAIAAIALVFTQFIFPQIRASITASTYCAQSFGCQDVDAGSGMRQCSYCKDEACNETGTVRCKPQEISTTAATP